MRKFNDSPEEAKIRELIVERGLGGKLSPKMVLQIPRELLYPHIMDGKRDYEIGKVFGVSNGVINILRKYYDLPKVDEVKKMLECVEQEPEPSGWRDETERLEPVTDERVAKVNPVIFDEMTEHILSKGKVEPVVVSKKEPLQVIIEDEEPHMTINEARVREGLTPLKEMNLMQTFELPLLDIKMLACMAAPLVNGVAKYLDRLDKEMVEVEVRVRLCEGK